jgi:hypothetical protein
MSPLPPKTPASTSLFRGVLTTGSLSATIEVPAGHTVIVKSALFVTVDATNPNLQYYAQSPPNSVFALMFEKALAQRVPEYWEGWLVLLPGDRLAVTASAANVQYWVSGSFLTGVATWTRPAIGELPAIDR